MSSSVGSHLTVQHWHWSVSRGGLFSGISDCDGLAHQSKHWYETFVWYLVELPEFFRSSVPMSMLSFFNRCVGNGLINQVVWSCYRGLNSTQNYDNEELRHTNLHTRAGRCTQTWSDASAIIICFDVITVTDLHSHGHSLSKCSHCCIDRKSSLWCWHKHGHIRRFFLDIHQHLPKKKKLKAGAVDGEERSEKFLRNKRWTVFKENTASIRDWAVAGPPWTLLNRQQITTCISN